MVISLKTMPQSSATSKIKKKIYQVDSVLKHNKIVNSVKNNK